LCCCGRGAGQGDHQSKNQTDIQYNSNFWKAENNETGVNTYYVGPGVVVGYETPKLTTSLDATLDLFWFDDQDTPPPGTRDASDDDYVGATVLGRVNYQATDRLNLGISDRFFVTRDPAEADINSDAITRDKYTLNFFQPEIYYVASSRIDLRAAYRNTIEDYEKDLEDSVEHRGMFDFIYNLNSRAATFLSYQIWARDYDQDSYDYTSNQVWLNYRHQFRYFTLTVVAAIIKEPLMGITLATSTCSPGESGSPGRILIPPQDNQELGYL
jgi:hypothetical protein